MKKAIYLIAAWFLLTLPAEAELQPVKLSDISESPKTPLFMRGIFALTLGSLLLLPVVSPTPSYSAEEKVQPDALGLLQKAHGQLEVAVKYAELALSPHQSGLGGRQAAHHCLSGIAEGFR